MAKTIDARLPGVLLPWYDGVKRELPWRENREPYRVWLSEIMLQQTRVEAVKGYFARFLEMLPDIRSLAECDDETLHKLWEGLGYYSRVRNLKKAAITIMEDHGGNFPREYESVRALPGIGDYTAGAICSICFDLPTPAVDGNVLRVAARLTEDFTPIDQPAVKKEVGAALAAIYPQRAGDFTQALMELGATLCGPNRKPDCDACPCREFCRAFQNGTAEQLPVKTPKKQRRVEEKTVLILSCEGRYALTKRHDGGLLAGLWQFPDFPGQPELPAVLEKVEELGLKPREIYKQVEKKHIFTHVEWRMNGYYLEVSEPEGPYTWLTAEEMDAQAAMPTAYRQFRE
ncbi:MAG: A/G-specific adenine glycosylase [Oscillospiraceae bacterium]|nr:A/G-specific adenine glycosylase [Oscillospiraceae bacterium]